MALTNYKSMVLLDEYLNYLEVIKGRSHNTVIEYRTDILMFLDFICEKRGIKNRVKYDVSMVNAEFLNSITLSEMYDFVGFCQTKKMSSPGTRSRKIVSIRQFWKYLKNKRHVLEENVAEELETPKQPKRLPKHLTLEESVRLLMMAEAAKKVINCVYEAKGRYGKQIIIDTVAGAKTARLEEIGTVRYKSYGVLAGTNKNLLRRLIEQLVLEGYLRVGDYQVLKLGDISGLKNPEASVFVKITDEDKQPEKTAKTKKKAKSVETLTSSGYKLFERLKKLRLEIAREESMPPYIIFSDKTLIDMAAKMPASKPEMLDVSGVGENKFAKYGERFLEVIEEYRREVG